ncbi:hypothetical protein PCK1_001495 [Pneumocystis canis]|nr:hypothetical protein PCK1_001495 [Pneumocystis canis]
MFVWRQRENWILKRYIFITFSKNIGFKCLICNENKKNGLKRIFIGNMEQIEKKEIKSKKRQKEGIKKENKGIKNDLKVIFDRDINIFQVDIERMTLKNEKKKVRSEFNLKTPKGTRDWDSRDIVIREDIFSKIIKVFKRHGGILNGIFEVSGVSKEKFHTISSALDKLDKLSWNDVKKEMVNEKGLLDSTADKIGNYVKNKCGRDLLEKLKSDELLCKHAVALEGIKDMEILYEYLEYLDIHLKTSFDLSLARGLDYYTGLIYEAVFEPNNSSNFNSLAKTEKKNDLDNDDDCTCIGSIAAGGRYDDLVGMFSPKKTGIPCVGISIGVERIFSILKSRFSKTVIKLNNTDVYVMEFGAENTSVNMIKERLEICKELWNSGINAQFFYKIKPKPRQQFKAAEKDHVPIAVIFGQNEIANGQVRIKILGLGEQSKGELVSRKEMANTKWNKSSEEVFLDKNLNKFKVINDTKDIKKKTVYEGIKNKSVGLDDLTLLSTIKDNVINDNLKKRFKNKEIYTYIGDVLISVNPFQELGIYTSEILQSYRGKNRLEKKPHVYAIAESAFYNMITYKENQCIIISGESGSGKTEAAKHIMQYIASVSIGDSSQIQEIKDIILATNPLLESFGCAKTLRNHNSSRHGKYIEIQFNSQSESIGANITNYLLEKSRVITQIKNERNFHIFYQFTKSANQYYRENYGIQGPEAYFYTSASDCLSIDGIDDSSDFLETCKAMKTIGLSSNDENNIFRILSIILWLGNIQFQEDQNGNAVVFDGSVTRFIAHLMNVDAESIDKALTTHVLETQRGGRRGSIYDVPLNPLQANSTKDTLAKSIYNNLFDWILKKINLSMKARENVSYTIGILDIYGFEIFENNSFEQICINYVNEKLQQIFVELILKAEQEEYVREEIKWTPINYFNNKIVCDLIERKYPLGIFAALNDAVATAHADSLAADSSFVQKLSFLASNPHFEQRQNQFIIKHYAGDVIYNIYGMTEKNKDNMLKDLLNLIIKSKDPFLHELFLEKINTDSKKKLSTSVDKIKESANDLVNSLMKCQPSYIRTIKPNSNKSPGEYNEKDVLHQIKYLGLQENIRIRRAGFAYRQTFNKFVERFYLLSRKCSYAGEYIWKGNFYSACEQIFKDIGIPASEYQMGITKVFIKHPETFFSLETMRDRYWHNMAIRIQRAWRNYLKYRNECITKIQRMWRRNKKILYYIKLRNQGHQILGGRKERCRASLLHRRCFIGDYMNINSNENLRKVYKNAFDINDNKKIEFSCIIELLCSKLGRSSKPKPKQLIMTNKMIYIFTETIVNNQLSVIPERSIQLKEIRHAALSSLSDNWVCLKFDSKNNADIFFSCVFKTEFITRLKLILNDLDLQIGPIIEYNKKPGKKTTIKFIIDPKIPINDVYKSGVVYVLPGEPANSISKQAPIREFKAYQSPKINKELKISPTAIKYLASRTNFSNKDQCADFLPAEPSPVQLLKRAESYYIALYDFQARSSNEMSFKQNEILHILHKENNGWWLAEKNGVEGWVPENYLRKERQKSQIPPSIPRPSLAINNDSSFLSSETQKLKISKAPSIPVHPSKLKQNTHKGFSLNSLNNVVSTIFN